MFIIVLFYFSFRLITINIDVVGENGRGIRSITSRERMKYLWHLFLYEKKKSKVFCRIRNANHVRAPFHQKRFTERKKLYSQPNHFFRSLTLYHYHPLTSHTASLTFSISSLWNSYMFLYIYYIYIIHVHLSGLLHFTSRI